jgi:predicted nucleic acid-binding protein
MSRIVLDTNVSSLAFKGRIPPSLAAKLVGRQPALTFVTVGELTRWAIVRRWGEQRRMALEHWAYQRPRIGADEAVAEKWGEITAYADLRGRPRPYDDSWIAACCLAFDLPPATLNVKHLEDFAEHEG